MISREIGAACVAAKADTKSVIVKARRMFGYRRCVEVCGNARVGGSSRLYKRARERNVNKYFFS